MNTKTVAEVLNPTFYVQLIAAREAAADFHDFLLKTWGPAITLPVATIASLNLTIHLLDTPRDREDLLKELEKMKNIELALKGSDVAKQEDFRRVQLGFSFC